MSESRPARRLFIVHNPTAGARRRAVFEATLAELRALGCSLALHETAGPGEAERAAHGAADGPADVVVAAGGDVTVNEVINGLARGAAARRPALAVLPLGTANVLAAEIGLGATPAAIARGAPRRISLGRANGRLFCQMVGVGFDAQVVEGVGLAMKRRIGKGAYLWQSLRRLPRFGATSYRVTFDGRTHEVPWVIVAKGRHYGGRFVLAPDADLAAPELSVVLFRRGGAGNLLRYAAGLAAGRLDRLRDVSVLRSKRVEIEGPAGDPVQGDGDIIARLPLQVSVVPDALELVIPD